MIVRLLLDHSSSHTLARHYVITAVRRIMEAIMCTPYSTVCIINIDIRQVDEAQIVHTYFVELIVNSSAPRYIHKPFNTSSSS